MSAQDRPTKRSKLLSDNSSSDESVDGHAPNGNSKGLKINPDYARRFEHNKKREEKERLEEKYGTTTKNSTLKRPRDNSTEEEDSDSSTSESEDDEAELVTQDVDDEIFATLQAIRRKDPKVYDKNVRFYREFDADGDGKAQKKEKEKAMYLHDYHRENLLAGHTGVDEEEVGGGVPKTYQQEQDALKHELVGFMHAATTNGDGEEQQSDEDEFLVAKTKPTHTSLPLPTPPRKPQIADADIQKADKDPETYLSNFMAARAWLPPSTTANNNTAQSWNQPLESDDSSEEARAEEFETAYNLRHEDPAAREKLNTFSRSAAEKYSVRRDDAQKGGGRKKARERERERKEEEKRERKEELRRLKKLKLEEVEQKVKRIREAGGLGKGGSVDMEEWKDVLEREFEGDEWEREMGRRFGEGYYAAEDGGVEGVGKEGKGKRKVRKPRWEDDIDIKDLVPDFEEEGEGGKAGFTLSSDDDGEDGGVPIAPDENPDHDDDDAESLPDHPSKKRKTTKKDRSKAKAESKRAARLERRQIESLVDASLPLEHPELLTTGKTTTSTSTSAPGPGFRYRDTSPTSFGLTARDILFADDAALNEFAGLKKLAAFRDEGKKSKDKRYLSKKQRLVKWRRETFGRDGVPEGGLGVLDRGEGELEEEKGMREKRKKRNRGKKGKGGSEAQNAAAPAMV